MIEGERSGARRVSGIVALGVGWLVFVWCALVVVTLVGEVMSDELVAESLVGYLVLIGVSALVGWWLIRWSNRQRKRRSTPPVNVEKASRSNPTLPDGYSSTAENEIDPSERVSGTAAQPVGSQSLKIWRTIFLSLAIVLLIAWAFVQGIIVGDLNQHLDGTEVVAVVISEPFEADCTPERGCTWRADYEIDVGGDRVVLGLGASANTRIGDIEPATYSTVGVLTFGTMDDRADELDMFSKAAEIIGLTALVFGIGWIVLRVVAKRSASEDPEGS